MTVKQKDIITGYNGADRTYTQTQHTFILELIKPKYVGEYSDRSNNSWFNRLTIFEHDNDYFICKGHPIFIRASSSKTPKVAHDIFTGISAIYTIEFIIQYLVSNIENLRMENDTIEYLRFLKAHTRVLNLEKLLKEDDDTQQYC
jgi:hypothetical protein